MSMKKLKTYSIPAFLVSVLLVSAGCATEVSETRGAPLRRVEALTAPVYYKPVFKVSDTKVRGIGTAGGLFNFDIGLPTTSGERTNGDQYLPPEFLEGLTPTEAAAVKTAIANVCKRYNAEYLFAPHYKLQTRTVPVLNFLWKEVHCEVSGFPATVEAVVPADPPQRQER